MKLNIKLKLKHYILFIIIILVCIYQHLFQRPNIVEGYQSYEDCLDQGYPINFCLQVPVQSYVGPTIY